MPPKRPNLTPKQQQLLDIYVRAKERGEAAPTMEEVAKSLGQSKTTVYEKVNTLIRKGYLVRTDHFTARNISLAHHDSLVRRSEVVDVLERELIEWPIEARAALIGKIEAIPEA